MARIISVPLRKIISGQQTIYMFVVFRLYSLPATLYSARQKNVNVCHMCACMFISLCNFYCWGGSLGSCVGVYMPNKLFSKIDTETISLRFEYLQQSARCSLQHKMANKDIYIYIIFFTPCECVRNDSQAARGVRFRHTIDKIVCAFVFFCIESNGQGFENNKHFLFPSHRQGMPSAGPVTVGAISEFCHSSYQPIQR